MKHFLVKEGECIMYNYAENENRRAIRQSAEKHQVKNLMHFTDVANLNNILERGLLTRETLNKKGYEYICSDNRRLDGRLDTISLSINGLNERMFSQKLRDFKFRKTDWCILVLDPSILWEKCNMFFTFNAASMVYRNSNENRTKVEHFENMFSTKNPTELYNDQAEVMCMNSIEPQYIKACLFRDTRTADKYREQLKRLNIDIYVDWRYSIKRMVA